MSHDEQEKLLAKISAVKRIARRAGYPEYKAEDISQQVALRWVEGRSIEKQTNYFSFVDAVREGSERAYNRGGDFRVPIYESSFEDYSNIVATLRCEFDPASDEENQRDLYDLISSFRSLEMSRFRIVVLYVVYGWTLGQISKFEGVCEARVRQKVNDAFKQIKKKIISNCLSQEKSCKRKLEEHRKVSFEIQNKSFFQNKTKVKLAEVYKKQNFNLGSFEIQEISEALCASF